MSGYLLDTSAWLCTYHEPDRLSTKSRQLILNCSSINLASISLWEVATKNSLGKLSLPLPFRDWLRAALPLKMKLLHLTPDVAGQLFDLANSMHPDPADRIIAATAIVHRLTILTSDQKLIDHPGVPTVDTR